MVTPPAVVGRLLVLSFALALAAGAPGCAPRPRMLPAAERVTIDRGVVEYPSGFVLHRYVENLTGATAIAFDDQGSLLIAEGGVDGRAPAIFGFRTDGSRFEVYRDPQLPFNLGSPKNKLYGPIGGMLYYQGRLYVTHRDKQGYGVITAITLRNGNRTTIVAGMPAQGDYGLTDLALKPDGRLYFGIGTATNSGVVGLDNWAVGWVRQYPRFHDQPWTTLRLRGVRMDSRNPIAGLFGPGEKAVTGAFQPFDTANKSSVYPPQNGKFNGAIYSVGLDGGDLRAEAYGIRLPRGLAFNELGSLFFTNNGMELRGTRPVKDDPDALCRLVTGAWYGWPDYSTDCVLITNPRFQPGIDMIFDTGYDALPTLIDHDASGREGAGLRPPPRDSLLRGVFPSQSGAAKLVMAPRTGPFERYQGSAFVALSGDRAPFATGNKPLIGRIGYKVVRVSVDTQRVEDFIRNTAGVPAHQLSSKQRRIRGAMERPADLKIGPDNALYILDMGRMEVRNGREKIFSGTGQIYRLVAEQAPPATRAAGDGETAPPQDAPASGAAPDGPSAP
jgi:glucose/arabinose dehydrogenase